jgi:alpha-N-dichloroacetyl-p-aminophenylserinol N-oxygenase
MRADQLPAHDPTDPLENAVIARLAGNWSRRAAVKRPEPSLDDLFEPARPDYPRSLIPFADHPAYTSLDEESQARIGAWGLIAFNKNIMDIERHVVNPGFAMIVQGGIDTGMGEQTVTAIAQAMVDEEYHVLMHLNASAVTRRRRGWDMPESRLPLAHKPRLYQRLSAEAASERERRLVALAFTVVAEVSVNSYLNLVEHDTEIQPISRTTAALHNRDEYCHSSIAAEVGKAVFSRLGHDERRDFLRYLVEGMEAFAATDFTTWTRILENEGVDAAAMLRDIRSDSSRKRILQDFSGIYRLCQEMNIVTEIDYDWSIVSVG